MWRLRSDRTHRRGAARAVAAAGLVLAALAPRGGAAQLLWDRLPGNTVLEPDADLASESIAVGDPAVVYQGESYHMWYTATSQSGRSIAYARSADGHTWTKYPDNPVLVDGTGQAWDSEAVSQPTVLYDNGQYRMWYTGYDGSIQQIGYATSSDGIAWSRQGSAPVLAPGASGAWDAAGVSSPAVVHDGAEYHMWYAGYEGQALRIGHATSSDGATWTRDGANPVLDLGSEGAWDSGGVTAPTVIHDGRTFRMLYSGRGAAEPALGYASSLTGSTWTRAPVPVLMAGLTGGWDGAGLNGPSMVFTDGVYHLYYGGNDGATGAIGYVSSRVPGDADGDGTISAMDAVLVLQYVVRLINEFPLGELSLLKDVPVRPMYKVSLSEGMARVGEPVEVQVTVDDAAGLQAGGIEIEYDASRLRAMAALPQALLNGCLWQTNVDLPGEVRCAFASAQPLTGEGALFNLTFESVAEGPGQTQVRLGDVTFNGTPAVHGTDGAVRFLPTAARLLDSYPNPFNGQTVLRYALPGNGPVSLSLYSASGQLVRELVAGERAGGEYEVRWDGLDRTGCDAASGAYFARLSSGAGTAHAKLTLLR